VSEKPLDCSTCRHHTSQKQNPVEPGALEDSVEDTMVNFSDEQRPFYYCQFRAGKAIGFEPVHCDAYEAPKENASAAADEIMAKYEARLREKG